MAGTFKFELVSPERVLLSAEAEQVMLPGADGDFTVLAGHAPVISTLRPGVLDVALQGGKKRVFVKGGFAEVAPTHVTVLAQQAYDTDELKGERLAGEIASAEAAVAAATSDDAKLMADSALASLKALSA